MIIFSCRDGDPLETRYSNGYVYGMNLIPMMGMRMKMKRNIHLWG
jgi:hypothetical protein